MKAKNYVIYYLILSVIAVLLVLVLIFLSPSRVSPPRLVDKLLLLGILILICLFGMSLGVYPGWLKKRIRNQNYVIDIKRMKRKRQGHHPYCDKYQNHTIQINNKILCTGCLGLSLGCLISIFFMIVYLIITPNLVVSLSFFIIFFGLFLIFFSYIEIVAKSGNKLLHIMSNIGLIIGFILIILGVFEITGQLVYGVLCIVFSILWLDTRIQLSNWLHRSICNNCIEECKMY